MNYFTLSDLIEVLSNDMTESEIEIALSHFGQVQNIFSRDQEGSGLGLPLSNGLVEAHGGTLEIESARGEGTTVSVRLPNSRLR